MSFKKIQILFLIFKSFINFKNNLDLKCKGRIKENFKY